MHKVRYLLDISSCMTMVKLVKPTIVHWSFMVAVSAKSLSRTVWVRGLTAKLKKPLRLQIAALCFREGGKEPEILLVSSRQRGRWILPKGWPEAGRKHFEVAAIEAYEEAGAIGVPDKRPLGMFKSFKGLSDGAKLATRVVVFKMHVDRMLKKFPEKGQRKVRWVPVSKAIDMVDEPTLSVFLKLHRRTLRKSVG